MKIKMHLWLTILVAIISTICLNAQQNRGNWVNYQNEIQRWLTMYKVPAVGIGIIEEGKLKQIMVFGDLKKNDPAPYNTIFQVASLTKPVTAMLTLKLVSMGKWQLDEPLSKYWIDPDVVNDPRSLKLTTRHVLTHQTGFDNWRWSNFHRLGMGHSSSKSRSWRCKPSSTKLGWHPNSCRSNTRIRDGSRA